MPDMTKLMRRELKKIRGIPRFTFYDFVYPNKIDESREKLRLARIKYRTEPVYENGILLGYTVSIEN